MVNGLNKCRIDGTANRQECRGIPCALERWSILGRHFHYRAGPAMAGFHGSLVG
jgi:hypothetical protein